MQQGQQIIYKGACGYIRKTIFSNLDWPQQQTNGLAFKHVFKGTEHYIVQGQNHFLKQGEVLIIPDNEHFSVQIDTNIPTQGICLDISSTILTDLHKDLFNEATLFAFEKELQTCTLPRALNPLSSIFRYFTQLRQPQEHILPIEETIIDLIRNYLYLSQDFSSKFQALEAEKKSTKAELLKRLIIAQAFIHDNLEESLDLNQVATIACISPFYFQRVFKQVFTYSPSQYLERIRMEKAINLLKTNQLSIKEIAFQVGFSDLQYFSRRFKKHFGNTPSQIRKLAR